MKLNADHLKRMTVADLKNLEQNISMWFHMKDRQRSVAATALGLRKSLTQKPTGFACQRASNFAERHSKAVLDCRDTFRTLSTAVKALMPSGEAIRSAQGPRKPMLEVSLKKRYGVVLKKADNAGVVEETSIVRRNAVVPLKAKDIATDQRQDAFTCRVLPTKESKPDSIEHAEKCLKDDVNDSKSVTDVNANTLPKRAPIACGTPVKGKRFSRPVPLRRIVILREHHKKCEIRIKELEQKTARLRREKSKLEQLTATAAL